MLASDRFEGSAVPFEGDRTLLFQGLPEGAKIERAVIILEPVAAPGCDLFEELITFANGRGTWGTSKHVGSGEVEVDFHARRTLASVTGSGLASANLQVDLGGLFVPISDQGTLLPPDQTNAFELSGATGGALPSLVTSRFKLRTTGGSPDLTAVRVRSTPSNLTVRLGQTPPFFARPGEAAAPISTLDFAEILASSLTDAEVEDGYYQLEITVHSDTIARLDVTVEVEYLEAASALPAGVAEAKLTFEHGSTAAAGAAELALAVPVGARVIRGATQGRIRGSFADSEIVYGPTGNLEPAALVAISPERSEATPLLFAANVAASAVDVLVGTTDPTAQLALDLVEDVDGKPWTKSVLPAPVSFMVDHGAPRWVHVPLPLQVQLYADTRYWLVLQSLHGEATWGVCTRAAVLESASRTAWTGGAAVGADAIAGTAVALRYTDTGGLSWKQESSPELPGQLAAFVHLRRRLDGFRVPIAIEIGAGDVARRVGLERFQPLGRVDFSLDIPELADAVNHVIEATGVTAAPRGEHLRNGKFESWRRVGDLVGSASSPLRIDYVPIALSMAPSGRLHVLGLETSSEESAPDSSVGIDGIVSTDTNADLEPAADPGTTSVDAAVPGRPAILTAYETACGSQVGSIDLGSGPATSLAVSRDSSRAVVGNAGNLTWVDLEAASVIGTSSVQQTAVQPVFSADGARLYVLAEDTTQVEIFSVSRVEAALRAGNEPPGPFATLPFDGQQPIDLAVAADGRRLYVVYATTIGTGERVAELTAFDASTQRIVFGPLPLGALGEARTELRSLRVEVSLDGSRLVVVTPTDGSLHLFEARRGIALGAVQIQLGDAVRGLALAPDATRAFVAGNSQRIAVVDLRTLRVAATRGVAGAPTALTLTPGGERLVVASAVVDPTTSVATGRFDVIPIGALVPDEWTLTSGTVTPWCSPGSSRAARIQGFDPPQPDQRKSLMPGAISEVVAVAGNARYSLSFAGVATTQDAEAEVFWYGNECRHLQTDRVAFPVSEGGGLDSGASALTLTRLDMTSPAGATSAEVRFTVTPGEEALLDNASLQATTDQLANPTLQGHADGRMTNWSLSPPDASGFTAVAGPEVVTLRNGSSVTVSLLQSVPFAANERFTVRFLGRGTPGAGTNATPTIRVAWLDQEGNDVGTNVEILLDAPGSDRRERRGTTPPETVQAELRLDLPAGTTLDVRQVSLDAQPVTLVPLTFVAQAPGELSVAGLQATYEEARPPPPPPPASGLCAPTPPGAQPGTGRQGACHCPCCGAHGELVRSEAARTSAGAPALAGDCPGCGAGVVVPGGQTSTRLASSALSGPRLQRLASSSVPAAVLAVSTNALFMTTSRDTRDP